VSARGYDDEDEEIGALDVAAEETALTGAEIEGFEAFLSCPLFASTCADPYGFLHAKQTKVFVGPRARLLVT
jgi:hypothetical protein